jgi:hypothetical protein
MAAFWDPFGTTASTWPWTRTVVSGIQRKFIPNQKELRAICLRFPNDGSVRGGAATAVAMARH